MFKYFFFCFLLAFCLVFISYFLILQYPTSEKMSIYECGFSPFTDSSSKFEMSFYIVAILFMIFDLEIVFLVPWVLLLGSMTYYGFFSMCFFLFMLMMGFIYEWLKGAMDWE